MGRKFFLLVAFCVVLFGAILAGYWDMLDSERLRAAREQAGGTVAELSNRQSASGSAPPVVEVSPSPEAAASDVNGRGDAAGPNASASGASERSGSAATPPVPRFDILRVEPDGSAVLAGRTAPNTEMRLTDGKRTIGSARTSPTGDFAIVLDERLASGDHRIRIETGNGANASVSQEAAIVSVPQPGRDDQVLAMVEAPDRPSRVISLPVAEDPQTAAPQSQVAASPGDEEASASPASRPSASSLGTVPPAPPGFAVEAVEIENGTVYVAGRAPGRDTVRVYVDDKLVGEDAVRNDERFLVTSKAELAVGDHRIRADMVGPNGVVASRVEVPFAKPAGGTMSAIASAEPPARQEPPAPASPAPTDEPAETHPGSRVVETVRQPALETVDARVLIRRGDTLWRISRETYGKGRRYTVIYLANGDQIRNPNRIYPGQVFRLPKDEQAPAATAAN